MPVASGSAATAAVLPVEGRAPKTESSREAFGPAWTDQVGVPGGHNGCDTRDDVLRRDLTGIQTVPGTGGCQVAAGTLPDPHSGIRIPFTRGVTTSGAVQIDHVVALSGAWQTGAFAWAPDKRLAFANDPLNLLAVQGSLNEAKGDGDAATWPPPNKTVRCAYIARQIAVKTAYGLWVTPAEQQASQRVLTGCPGQALPTETGSATSDPAPGAPVRTAPQPTPSPSPAPARPTAGPSTAAGVYYANCAAVRAAGKAPLYRGQPGYRAALDGDGNGVACQTETSGGAGSGGGSGTGGGVGDLQELHRRQGRRESAAAARAARVLPQAGPGRGRDRLREVTDGLHLAGSRRSGPDRVGHHRDPGHGPGYCWCDVPQGSRPTVRVLTPSAPATVRQLAPTATAARTRPARARLSSRLVWVRVGVAVRAHQSGRDGACQRRCQPSTVLIPGPLGAPGVGLKPGHGNVEQPGRLGGADPPRPRPTGPPPRPGSWATGPHWWSSRAAAHSPASRSRSVAVSRPGSPVSVTGSDRAGVPGGPAPATSAAAVASC